MPRIEITDQLLKSITKAAMELDYESYVNRPKHHFSHCFRKKMRQDSEVQQKNQKELYVYNRRFSGRRAILLIAVLAIIMGMTAFAVSPFVEQLGNLKFIGHPGYMEIEVTDGGAAKDGFVAYVPTEIPEGYELCEEESWYLNVTVNLVYDDGKNKLYYEQTDKTVVKTIGISNKNMEKEKIAVIGEEGYYIADEKENTVIVEKGDYIFSLSGALPKEELIEILNSIEQKKN